MLYVYVLHLHGPNLKMTVTMTVTVCCFMLFYSCVLSRSKRVRIPWTCVRVFACECVCMWVCSYICDCVYALIWPVAVAFMQLPNIYYRFLHNIVPLPLLLLFVHFFFICLFFFVMCVFFLLSHMNGWMLLVHRIDIARSLSFAILKHIHWMRCAMYTYM